MSLLDDLGSALSDIAPYLATTIGGAAAGPVGAGLARAAVGFVAERMGVEATGDPEADAGAVAEALRTAQPTQIAALRKADQEYRRQMRALDIEEVRVHQADRHSARWRQVETGDWLMPPLIACIVSVGMLGFGGVLMFHDVGAGAENMIMFILGSFATIFAKIGAFYFGSSSGSKAKTTALTDALARR